MRETTSCPRLMSDVLDLEHAASCLDCASLEQSRQALRRAAAEPSADDLRRVWAGVADRSSRSARPGSLALGGLGAAAVAAGLVLIATVGGRAAPPGELVSGRAAAGARALTQGAPVEAAERLVVVEPASIVVASARIEAEALAEITLDVSGSRVRLDAGTARFVAHGGDGMEVHTPHAHVSARQATVRVGVIAARTVVDVDEGEVEVRVAGQAQVVRAGERVAIAPAVVASRAEVGVVVGEAAVGGGSAQTEVEARTSRARTPARPVAPRTEPAAPPPAAEPRTGARSASELPAAELARARAILSRDPAAARALVETVRAQRPPPAVEAEALMIESDAARRSHDLPGALALCARVIDHPSGEPFAEEAMLRAARIHVSLDQPDRAAAVLSAARQRFARGPLVPEREALAAKLARERGDLAGARAAIESVSLEGRSLPLADERLALAEALRPHDREAARALALPLTAARWPDATRARAQQLVDTTSGGHAP